MSIQPPPSDPQPTWRVRLTHVPWPLLALPSVAMIAGSLWAWPPSTWEQPLLVMVVVTVTMLSGLVAAPLRGGGFISPDFTLMIALAAIAEPSAAILAATLAAILASGILVGYTTSSLARIPLNVAATVLPIGVVAIGLHQLRQSGMALVDPAYFIVVTGAFCLALAANFVIAFAPDFDHDGRSMRSLLDEILRPLAPYQFCFACIAGLTPLLYAQAGPWSLTAGSIAALGFSWFVRELLESRARLRDLEEFSLGTLHTLVQSISHRDNMTGRHSAAVSRYAQAIARELGLEERRVVATVRRAGILHDIGKHVFTDHMLRGGEKLSDDEFELMKAHPAAGWSMLRQLPGHAEVANIVRHHHERVDGRGYPDGLSGEAIPIESRIIAVADVFDVMTARDTYRQPVSVEEAVSELRRVSGSQLDGACVEAFIRILERHPEIKFDHTSDRDLETELRASGTQMRAVS